MRFRLCYAMAGAALLTGSITGTAHAQGGPSAYVSLGGGAIFKNDQDFSGAETTSDTGWGILSSAGYRWGNGWRAELEMNYRRNDGTFKDFALGTNSGGSVRSFGLMANGLYDFAIPQMGAFSPYLGFGMGAVANKYEFLGSAPKNTNFAYQGIAGITWHINDVLEAFADYRYLSTAGQNVSIAGHSVDDDYMSHNILVGLRWTFWKEQPPAAPAAAPTPQPQSRPADWTVYFEYNKSNLTNAADAVLDEIKSETTSAQSVSVVGHTDTSGSPQYNEALSNRRAQRTAEGLGARGVTVSQVSGVGESDPAVQTGDGVKEPLNRRAVVRLDAQQTNM